MMILTPASTNVLVPAVVVFAVWLLLVCRIAAIWRRPAPARGWTPELSVDRYQPMLRLLQEDDIQFLRQQPGVTPALVKRLRRNRYLVFQGYLHSLQADFHRACEALTVLALHAETDQRDLIRSIIRHRLKFRVRLLQVRWRLVLYRWNAGSVPVRQLVGLLDSLQTELLALNPART